MLIKLGYSLRHTISWRFSAFEFKVKYHIDNKNIGIIIIIINLLLTLKKLNT